MKVTIEINTDNDHYEDAAIDALKGRQYRRILEEIDSKMRHIYKYEEHSDETLDVVDRLRGELRELISDLIHEDIL